MIAPYDSDALWMKSRLFINHAMDDANSREFTEQALWASLALELLGKAALASVSPLLIATPDDGGDNFLRATGLIQGDADFHTITAKTVFTRCQKAFRPFSYKEAERFARDRNAYLHSGAATMTSLPADVWWSKFWAQAQILLTAQDKDVEEYVGADRVTTVEVALARNQTYVHERVTALIEQAKQRLSRHAAGLMSDRQAQAWTAKTQWIAGLAHSVDAACPACAGTGRLEGDEVLEHEWEGEQGYDGEVETWVNITVASDWFSCPQCHLVLPDAALITAADLAAEFTTLGDPADFAEADYGND